MAEMGTLKSIEGNKKVSRQNQSLAEILGEVKSGMLLRRTHPKVVAYTIVRQKRDWSNLPFFLLELYRIFLVATPFIALWIVLVIHGLPYILWEYNRYTCTYYSFHAERTLPNESDCSFIRFIDVEN